MEEGYPLGLENCGLKISKVTTKGLVRTREVLVEIM